MPGRHRADPAGSRRQAEIGETGMGDQEQAELRLQAARLRQEHEDYDAAIAAMLAYGCDALRIQRMKKKKLALKDRITEIEDQITPDIIA
jgi:hypothetical protein